MTDQPDFSLEAALSKLEEIAQQLEDADQSLDEAVALFAEGQSLIKRCQEDLDAKDLKIQQIMSDGGLAPFDRQS